MNPHPTMSFLWHLWKEENEGWLPYHVGTTPAGAHCSGSSRCFVVRPGVYRCRDCGKEFPTFRAEADRLAAGLCQLGIPARDEDVRHLLASHMGSFGDCETHQEACLNPNETSDLGWCMPKCAVEAGLGAMGVTTSLRFLNTDDIPF